jgi:hypothetical protein
MTRPEKLMLGVFALVASLWMTTALHGINYAVVALIGICVLLLHFGRPNHTVPLRALGFVSARRHAAIPVLVDQLSGRVGAGRIAAE